MKPPLDRRFDWLVACASYLLSGGILIDAWSHYHETIETFFTPSHAVIYGAFAILFGTFGWKVLSNKMHGYAWNDCLPHAYRWSALGIGIFFIGGLGDMAWHAIMGIEQGIDVLLSPTHMTIGLAILLIISGPIRSNMENRPSESSFINQLPAWISLAAILSVFHFATQFAMQPGADAANAPLGFHGFSPDLLTLLTLGFYKQGFGLVIMMLQALLMSAISLLAVTNLPRFPGMLTIILVLGNIQAGAMLSNGPVFFVTIAVMSVVAGIVGDVYVWRFDPSTIRVGALRVFGGLVPAVYSAAYILTTDVVAHGVWWDPNVIFGAILYSAAVGLGLTFLVVSRGASI